jgi:hypothetical protein
MQNYGKFFIRPKRVNQNVDKWSIEKTGNLFYQIDEHILRSGLIFHNRLMY